MDLDCEGSAEEAPPSKGQRGAVRHYPERDMGATETERPPAGGVDEVTKPLRTLAEDVETGLYAQIETGLDEVALERPYVA